MAADLYVPRFPEGTSVRVASREYLDNFLDTWRYHHKLTREQLNYADIVAKVTKVSFYHGGDQLYSLDGVPGIWHEQCLRSLSG